MDTCEDMVLITRDKDITGSFYTMSVFDDSLNTPSLSSKAYYYQQYKANL